MTGDAEEYTAAAVAERLSISAYSLRKKLTYLDILLATDPPCDLEVRGQTQADTMVVAEPIKTQKTSDEVKDSKDHDLIKERLVERIRYVYPDEELTRLPEKLSVSVLYPAVLDGADEGVSIGDIGGISLEPAGIVPSFISGIDKDESKKRGIVTHLFMQFCDVKRVIEFGARDELERLFSDGFISREDKERVRVDEIERFASSELAHAMASAKQVLRELRFNIKLPAERFTKSEVRRAAIKDREVLVQGVIDCVIIDNDGNILCLQFLLQVLLQ